MTFEIETLWIIMGKGENASKQDILIILLSFEKASLLELLKPSIFSQKT